MTGSWIIPVEPLRVGRSHTRFDALTPKLPLRFQPSLIYHMHVKPCYALHPPESITKTIFHHHAWRNTASQLIGSWLSGSSIW